MKIITECIPKIEKNMITPCCDLHFNKYAMLHKKTRTYDHIEKKWIVSK